MGGIVGVIHGGSITEGEKRANVLLEQIRHRGPDKTEHSNSAKVSFRCCYVKSETESARTDENILMVMDGRIRNVEQINQALQAGGHGFSASEQDDLLLQAFTLLGTKLFALLDGPFAIAIWDKNTKTLYLARDGFGVKPLYYTNNTDDGSFLFASEIKAFIGDPHFKKAFNRDALRPYMTFEYSTLEETFFEGVYKVQAGEYVVLNEGQIQTKRFFDIPLGLKKQSMDELVMQIHTILENNRPDEKAMAEMGGFLSGGIDSSYLTALYRPTQTFSVGFPGETANFDETNLAKELSDQLSIQNHTRLVDADQAFARFTEIQYYNDEPQANPSAIAIWFLAEHTKKHVDMVVTGEGADEIFAGYHWYNKSYWQLAVERCMPRGIRRYLAKKAEKHPHNRISRLLVKSGQSVESHYIGHAKIFVDDEVHAVLKPAYLTGPTPQEVTAPYFKRVEGLDDLSTMRYLDFHLWSPGEIMQKSDRMCMAHSLMTYMPFVDKNMMAVGMSAPPKLLISPQTTKRALRMAAASVVPKANTERVKLGFEVPVRAWLRREPYFDIVKKSLNDPPAATFFHLDLLNRLLDEHKAKTHNHARKIWTVYAFLTWYRRYFAEEIESE